MASNLRGSGNRESPRKINAGRGKSPIPSPSIVLKAPDAGWANRKSRITPVSSPRQTLHHSDSSSDIPDTSPTTILKSDRTKMIDSQDSESTDDRSLSRGNSVVLCTDDEVITNTGRIISDYFEEESPEDAVDSLKPFITSTPSLVISQIISLSFEKKDGERKLITELFPYLRNSIIHQDFEKAFEDCFSSLEDLVYDIPNASDYLGYFLANASITQCVSEDFVKPTKIKEYNLSLVLMERVLGTYFKTIYQKDSSLFQTIYQPFRDNIQNFVKDGKNDRFFNTYGLEHLLLQPEAECSTPSRAVLSTRSLPENRTSPNSSPEQHHQQISLSESNHDILNSSDEFVPPSTPISSSQDPEINQENYLQKTRKPRGRGTIIK